MLKIDEMWAYVADNDEGEGVCAFQDTMGAWMPMVGADTERMELLRPTVGAMATALGQPIKLLRFTVREDVEVIEP